MTFKDNLEAWVTQKFVPKVLKTIEYGLYAVAGYAAVMIVINLIEEYS